MKRLALLGASGHGKVVADAALSSGWDEVVFFDDAWPQLMSNGLWQISGDSSSLVSRLKEFQGVIVSIGDCAVRLEKHKVLQTLNAPLVTVVHSAASVSRFAVIGVGTVIMAGAVVNIDAVVGQAGIINTNASVDHDCHLADGVHICPGANLSGGVRVGEATMVGAGVAVRQGVTIGCQVVIGVGSVIVGDVGDRSTIVGNPGRELLKTKF